MGLAQGLLIAGGLLALAFGLMLVTTRRPSTEDTFVWMNRAIARIMFPLAVLLMVMGLIGVALASVL
jgi:hypothetical protein